MDSLCPITSEKRCALVSADFIHEIGDNVAKPVSLSDLAKLTDMSNIILYNEEDTMRGRLKTMVINLGDSGSWLRLNASQISDMHIRSFLQQFNCK